MALFVPSMFVRIFRQKKMCASEPATELEQVIFG